MTVEYEMIVVNMHNARSSVIEAYRTSDMVYESSNQAGVCILFDDERNIDKVVSSNEDILYDTMMEVEAVHTHYCMIYDEDKPMTDEEIEFVYEGIQNGDLNIMLIEDETRIAVYTTNN